MQQDVPVELTPLQQRTLAALRKSGEPVTFDPQLVEDLRAQMDDALDHFSSRLGDTDDVFISKNSLSSALGCEAHHVAREPFAWSPASAKGEVAHKAVQLLVSWRDEVSDGEVVDAAIDRLVDDGRGAGSWIRGCDKATIADLTSQAVERVAKFRECFPPLTPRSAPVTETRVQWPPRGRIVLSGKVDLTLGRPHPTESNKVIVDYKTGGASPLHRQDLGFYALVETLRASVPPRKIATLYLDSGDTQAEDVSEPLLFTALRRTLDGIDAIIRLEVEEATPAKRPGASCRWCPLADNCDEGRAYLAGGEP